jgi:hypothetical protein
MAEMSMADKLRHTQFLGREFLTWLMFRSSRDEGVFKLRDRRVAELFFERAMTLDGDNPAREMSSIKVDDPAQSEEVMLSLRLGKKVSRARLLLLVDGHEYSLVLDGPTLGMRSVKLPDALAPEFSELMGERAGLAKTLEDTLHGMFLDFVRLRLDQKKWAKEAVAIRQWLVPSVAAVEGDGGDDDEEPEEAPRPAPVTKKKAKR